MTTTLRLSPPAARLMVLVPEGNLPVVALAQRIWALARAAGAAVLLVGLADRPEREPQARRQLAELQSHTQYDAVPVSTRVAHAADWVAAVRQLRRPGDQVVVLGEQRAPAGVGGWRTQPLARALQAQLQVPTLVVTDVALPAARRPRRSAAVLATAASLAVVGVFFGLQVWLTAAMPGGVGSLLQVVIVLAEFGLLARFAQRS